MKKFLFVIFICISLCSCKTVHEVLANQRFNNSIGEKELARPNENNKIPFTLNSKLDYGCPVVCLKINYKKAYFMVDTGSPVVMLSDKGLEKLGLSSYQFKTYCMTGYRVYLEKHYPEIYEKVKRNYKKLSRQFDKDLKKGLTFSGMEVNTPYFNDFYYGQLYDSKIDGILGLSFLCRYKRVTFDFINNYMILDDEKLDGNATPLFLNMEAIDSGEDAHCCIDFNYKGKREVGMLDTGNYTFSPRSNFGKDENHYQMEYTTSDDIFYKKLKKRVPIVHTYNDIEICGIRKDKIKGVYSNILFSTYSKAAQEHLMYVNGIGCELFRDCIIQFDFENKLFVVKQI